MNIWVTSLLQNICFLGADPSKPRCRKAKEIRKENKLQKLAKKAEQVCHCIHVI